ncbi:MAG: hypothetical protein Q9M92_09355 [Enterobacterales bacterium]|nr:hypothetical protein [Enterobacterales bacterium]
MAKIFVHHLHYQKAEKLLPSIQAQLDKNAKLSANEYQLIVNSSLSDNIKVLNILKDLDQPRKSYLVEIKLQDKAINHPSNTQGRPTPLPSQLEQQMSHNKNYRIAAKGDENIYFQASALDNIPLIVKQLVSYPISSVILYQGFYFPTAKKANLQNGFEIIIHQTKGNQVLVQISATAQTAKSKQPEARIKLLASTELLVKKNQWTLFAASNSLPYATAVNPQAKQIIPRKLEKPGSQTLVDSDSVKNNLYTTGKGNRSAKWFYLKITELPTD